MKKFAVVLCGCGSLDGSEIHESVMTLLAIDKSGSSYTVFAPNDNQYQVINHITKQPVNQTRNMMEEASRISRGKIPQVIQHVEAFGAIHRVTNETEVISDIENLVFTSPCYMLQASIKEIAESADQLIQVILKHI
ncbi:MAG TPA: hypothetical protein PKG88_00110 [Bacteroidales bacterium]|nr:hypothetical protein [Bacteroidales bacterium]HPS70627.1 hypothetical protein [Bacteroidales bacterium]